MGWLNFWKWPIELIEDIRLWFVLKSALAEPETQKALKSFKYELRIDNLLRIYTVVNIPEELWALEHKDQLWPWMVEQLRELDDILMARQLNDILFPKVSKIEGSPSYLIVLWPSTDSLSWIKFFGWLFNLGFTTGLLYLIDSISTNVFHQSILDFFTRIFI